PYTVKLYRYNVLYATKTAKVKNITFDSLPVGSYYAKAWGDGATGNAFGKSKTVNVVPIPGTLPATAIGATKATLHWTLVSCAKFDSIYYRVHGTTTWTQKNTVGNKDSLAITGLTASTTYDWQVAAVDSANGIIARGPFSPIAMFITTTTPLANGNSDNSTGAATGTSFNNRITVLPNPAVNYFVIKYFASVHEKVTATLIDVNGKAVWNSGLIDGVSLDGRRVRVDQFAKGIFYLKIINENGELMATAKLVIAK
ncbi:MAG TPA: T9SS type A sorting domain-containing protein, partial [Parafilimonas sp.]|nr:T9SS type A sorting domain-containing protein [Parafilimonas sp.]